MKSGQENLSIAFLYDDTLDSDNGVAQYVKTVGAWLSAQGHAVSYLVGETKMKDWAGGKVYSLSSNRTVIFNGNRLSMPMPAREGKIREVLARQRFDIMHVQVPYSPFMAKRVIENADSSTAVVGTFHIFPASHWVEKGSKFLRWLLRRSLKRFDAVVSVSPPATEFAQKVFGLKTRVLPNVVDVARFAEPATKSPKSASKRVVFLGRLVERKGCLQLLKAFNELHRILPEVQLFIAGDGPQRPKLERYVKSKKLGKSVIFLGYIPEHDKPSLLASADIACFPSLYGESFGIVLIEAMASGAKTVLGGDNPGYASVLGKQRVLLVDANNTIKFAERMKKLIIDKPLKEEIRKWQSTEVKRYDIKNVGPQILDLYEEAIATRHKSRHN